MKMTIKAHQARSMTNTALAKDNELVKEAEEFIRRRVQGKISLMARSGLITVWFLTFIMKQKSTNM